MEGIIGAVAALALSLGYTELKIRKQKEQYNELSEIVEVLEEDTSVTELNERVDAVEQNLGRNMLAAMLPMSKSIKELQETVGMR